MIPAVSPKMRPFLLAGLLGAALLVIYGFRLDFPAVEYYDEVYHVKTAREYAALKGNTDTAHPPLGKLILAETILIGGDHSWVWRTSSLVCGISFILAFFFLARKFFGSDLQAFTAAVLLSLDGMTMTQSRIAMLNTPMFLFMLLSLVFFLKALEKSKIKYFLLTGIFLGMTASTRWVGLGILPVMGMVFLGHFHKIQKLKFILKSLLLILPAALFIYFAAHIILLYSINFSWRDVLHYQKQMLAYHANLKSTHIYQSSWWSWPLMIRPIWYFFETKDHIVNGIFCVGNPAVFWGFLPASVYAMWHFLKTRSLKTLFVLAGFLSQWLPWAFIGRCKFFHYFNPCVPFMVLIIMIPLRDLWGQKKAGRIIAASYLLLVVGMFIYWYPLYTGYPIAESYYKNHIWFKRWI